MRGKAAVDGYPEVARRHTNILVTELAGGALPAADPGIYGDLATRLYVGIRPGAFDPAGNFMTKRERQRTPGANIKPFLAAEGKIPILHVQIGVADAATFDPHQNLGVLWSRNVRDRLAQRTSIDGQRLPVHLHG